MLTIRSVNFIKKCLWTI